MDCADCIQNILTELGHRASMQITLFHNNKKLERDFTPKAGDILQLNAAYNQGLTNEEMKTLLHRIENSHHRDMPDLFENLSEAAKDTKDVVYAVVKHYPECLVFASDLLRNDKDIVLKAICRNGNTLAFASEALRNEKTVVMKALLDTNRCALKFASDPLRNDSKPCD